MFKNLTFQILSSESPPPVCSFLLSFIPALVFSLLAIWIFADSKRKTYPHGVKFALLSLITIIPLVLMIFANVTLFFIAAFLTLALPFLIGGIYQKLSDDYVKLLWRDKFASGKLDSDVPTPTPAKGFEKSDKLPPGDLPLFSVPPRVNIQLLPFNISTTFTISDEFGNEYARIAGKIFALNPTYNIYDAYGNEIGSIVGRLFSFRPAFDIFYAGIGYVATVKGKVVSIRPEYWIENPAGDVIFRCFGDILSLEFKIVDKNSQPIAVVTRLFPSLIRTYNVILMPGSDPSLIIPLIIVIGAERHTTKAYT